jgi:hypothetical protein
MQVPAQYSTTSCINTICVQPVDPCSRSVAEKEYRLQPPESTIHPTATNPAPFDRHPKQHMFVTAKVTAMSVSPTWQFCTSNPYVNLQDCPSLQTRFYPRPDQVGVKRKQTATCSSLERTADAAWATWKTTIMACHKAVQSRAIHLTGHAPDSGLRLQHARRWQGS